jgi:predicted nuclease of restriction endonuclease-like (RecB) superfamily
VLYAGFAEVWPEEAIVQQFAAQLPRFHNITILEKLKSPEERLWYIRASLQHGWSGAVLHAPGR